MAGRNCSYWHCQRLRPPLQRSPFWIPDLPVASSELYIYGRLTPAQKV